MSLNTFRNKLLQNSANKLFRSYLLDTFPCNNSVNDNNKVVINTTCLYCSNSKVYTFAKIGRLTRHLKKNHYSRYDQLMDEMLGKAQQEIGNVQWKYLNLQNNLKLKVKAESEKKRSKRL